MKNPRVVLILAIILCVSSCSNEQDLVAEFWQEAEQAFAEVGLDKKATSKSVLNRFPVGTPVYQAMCVIVPAVSARPGLMADCDWRDGMVAIYVRPRRTDPYISREFGIWFDIDDNAKIKDVQTAYNVQMGQPSPRMDANVQIVEALFGRSRQQAKEWLQAHTVSYGFESREFLLKTDAKSVDDPNLNRSQGRFNGLLKNDPDSKRPGVTEVDQRIYVYISDEGRVSAVVVTEVVTGP